MIYFQYPGVSAKKRNQNCKFRSLFSSFSTPLIIIRAHQVMKDWIFETPFAMLATLKNVVTVKSR